MIKESRKAQYGENKIPSDKTLNNNSLMIIKLMKALNITDDKIDFIYDTESIDKYLQDKSVSTKRNYYSVILSLVNYDKYINKKDNQDTIIKYQNKINSLEKIKKTNESKGIMNDKKTEKLDITNTDMNKFMKTLLDNGLMKDYVIMTILNQYPIRAEISNVKFIDLKSYNKLKKDNKLKDNYETQHNTNIIDFLQTNLNYIVYGSKKIILSRADYKTSKMYGRLEDDITGKAKSVLKKYIIDNKFSNGDSLFDMTNDELTKRLFYISNKYLNTPLSVNSIAKLTIRNMIDSMKKSKKYKEATTPQQTIMDKQLIQYISKVRGTSFDGIWNSYVR
tara:strand:- start:130 stop:1134 length:1005 start_codon:yes stop_codon:yes gene_type:complete